MPLKTNKVRVALNKTVDYSYDIVIGSGLFGQIGQDLAKKSIADKYVVIADATVMKLYGNDLHTALKKAGLKAHRIAFPAGESSKSRKMKQFLEEHMLGMGLGRDSCVIALGGGVTGDLAGFTAATYLRGVPFIQVPTTLLAMVDASIGGKTAIDVPEGKNLIGAFHQPHAVYIDVDTLDSLPRRHLLAGMAEVVKHGVIKDIALFESLEETATRVIEGDQKARTDIIAKSCQIKAQVVAEDEKETDYRRILNYGHTIGHAFEAISDFSLLHGEAVSLGMALEGALSAYMGFMPENDLARQNKLLKELGLPVKAQLVMKAFLGRAIRPKEIIDYTHADKKVRQGMVEYVLPLKIGQVKKLNKNIGVPVDDKTVTGFLRKQLS